ncbi:hypothetical protein KAR91_69410 [Candidatus Pacearchaeota archaeon]|nr:hypothetical protein [Candidatus Pacearchaeota archaeon]
MEIELKDISAMSNYELEQYELYLQGAISEAELNDDYINVLNAIDMQDTIYEYKTHNFMEMQATARDREYELEQLSKWGGN